MTELTYYKWLIYPDRALHWINRSRRNGEISKSESYCETDETGNNQTNK